MEVRGGWPASLAREGYARALVVGIVGGTAEQCGKAVVVNNLVDRELLPRDCPVTTAALEVLDVYHDEEAHVLYLQLSSVLEASLLVQVVPDLTDMTPNAVHKWLIDSESTHLQALLYMFTVCHHMLILQPRCQVDLDLVHALRTVQLAQQKLASPISLAVARSCGLDERSHKKLQRTLLPSCFIPSVAFIFPAPPITATGEDRRLKLRKLSDSLQAQLDLLLSSSGICQKPARGERGGRGGREGRDTPGGLFVLDPTKSIFLLGDSFSQREALPFMSLFGDPAGVVARAAQALDAELLELRSAVALNLENVRQHLCAGKALPTAIEWHAAASALHEAVFHRLGYGKLLGADHHVALRLSQGQSASAMVTARKLYLRDLPPVYGEVEHTPRLLAALSLFRAQASGPAVDDLEQQLNAELTDIWNDGRRKGVVSKTAPQPGPQPMPTDLYKQKTREPTEKHKTRAGGEARTRGPQRRPVDARRIG